jgi:putative hydrolases of HD superfamily
MKPKAFLSDAPMKDMPQRLQRQIEFILEIDKLKQVMRRTRLLDESRTENDAEHSWHLAMMAMVLAEYADPDVNMNHVLRMVLIHDLVEIDAGDTFAYDESPMADSRVEREQVAAKRIYGLLPEDTGAELLALWEEFEEQSLDRLQPVLYNYFTGGGSWSHPDVTANKVRARQQVMGEASPPLWNLVEALLSDAVNRKILKM